MIMKKIFIYYNHGRNKEKVNQLLEELTTLSDNFIYQKIEWLWKVGQYERIN